MSEIMVSDKIIWRRENLLDLNKTFYPSFYKDINKRLNYFHEHFDFQFVKATEENMLIHFLPLYENEIISRDDFLLNKETIVQELLGKITRSRAYMLLLIFHKGEVILATLFSVHNFGLFVGYRAYKKNFNKKLSHDATVAYWGEKLLFDYGKEQKMLYVSRGKDTHPYRGKSNIGRPLYKLKTGVRPKKPSTKDYHELSISKKDVVTSGYPFLFFSAPDADGFYQNGALIYAEGSLADSYINEFQKVFSWAKISFTAMPYKS